MHGCRGGIGVVAAQVAGFAPVRAGYAGHAPAAPAGPRDLARQGRKPRQGLDRNGTCRPGVRPGERQRKACHANHRKI